MILQSKKAAAKRLAILVLGLVLGLGLTAGAMAATPITAGTDTAWHGNLTAGAKFGTVVGGLATDLPAALWQQGYGFEGVAACSAETEALFGCRPGEIYMVFQPVELGRKGHVYFKVDDNRISQIGWDLKIVAYSDG